jgi:DNA-binding beta-propeller fold protein YncE
VRNGSNRLLAGLTAMLLGAGLLSGPPATATDGRRAASDVKKVVFVGNNWDGTATILDSRTFEQIGRINIIPDRSDREMEIATNPDRLAFFLAVREEIGEGHNQYVDDMYSSNDGRLMIVSRPSYADVVAIRLSDGSIKWRFPVSGYRSDHMAISPDGRTVVVSASTGNVVHALDVQTGDEVGQFPSGDSPHESVFIDHGHKILHASIGRVYTPTDSPETDTSKGQRVFQIVRTRDWKVIRTYNLRKKFDKAGRPNLATAVRPLTLSPDERVVYFQVSFFHGFIKMNLRTGKVKKFVKLPKRTSEPRENYVLDSAHHGIAMNPDGTKICVAGTMDDYATVVDAKTYRHSPLIARDGGKPYWVTQSRDGQYCYISWSGIDKVSRISYRTARVVDTTKVGDHPQRVRNAFVASGLVAGLPDYHPADDVQDFPPIPALP